MSVSRTVREESPSKRVHFSANPVSDSVEIPDGRHIVTVTDYGSFMVTRTSSLSNSSNSADNREELPFEAVDKLAASPDPVSPYPTTKHCRVNIPKMTKLPHLPVTPTPSYPTLPRGVLLKCPMADCSKEFTRKNSVLRHLKQKHELAADRISNYKANLSTVKSKCEICGRWVSNARLARHKKNYCKGMSVEPRSSGQDNANPRQAVQLSIKKKREKTAPTWNFVSLF